MLETAHALIRRIGKKAGLEDDEIEELIRTDTEHHFEIKLENGKTFPAHRVQHNNKFGPYKGGIRFHPQVDANEIRALATLMSLKTAAVGLPLGGGKGGVAVNPRELTIAELEELSRKYAAHIAPHIGPDKDVPAPDVNTDGQIIDWMVDEFSKITGDKTKASFTGKTLANGGSLGREAATGRGGVITLRQLLAVRGEKGQQITYALQGFGNVGSFFATVAETEHPDWKLVAASDSGSTIVDERGLSAGELARYKGDRGRFSEYNDAAALSGAEEIIKQDVDVLVLAALENSITVDNMKDVKARIVVELANGPVTEEAHDFLIQNGVTVLPDILANAGGVIVSYIEWLQNRAEEHWPEEKVNDMLEEYLVSAFDAIYTTSQKEDMSLKEAAFAVAIRRLAEK